MQYVQALVVRHSRAQGPTLPGQSLMQPRANSDMQPWQFSIAALTSGRCANRRQDSLLYGVGSDAKAENCMSVCGRGLRVPDMSTMNRAEATTAK